jgi:Na+-driven multidrug efflux pump
LDGVLMGAGDVGYLRTVTITAALGGFLPMTVLAYALHWGLGGVWAGLTLFILLRLVGMVWRTRGERWALVGAN